jgi:hypothetical protein
MIKKKNGDKMTRRKKWGKKKHIKKKDHRGYTEILFSTHSVLLKRSQRNNSNCTLKER